MNRKEEILQFIRQFRKAMGYAPSFREIVAGTSVRSTSTVHRYLVKLEEDGLIRRARDLARSIVPLDGREGSSFLAPNVTLLQKRREQGRCDGSENAFEERMEVTDQ